MDSTAPAEPLDVEACRAEARADRDYYSDAYDRDPDAPDDD